MEPATYNDLLAKNITKSYKKASPLTTETIRQESKRITAELGIDDRVDVTANKEAFITLKDHKPNFANNPTCRLINPTKPELGKISKQILDRVNAKVIAATKINQWKNTPAVIDWFNTISLGAQRRVVYERTVLQRCRSYLSQLTGLLTPLHVPPPLRLTTSRLANIFGNDTMYRHDKKIEKRKNSRKKPNAPEPEEIVRRTFRKSNSPSVFFCTIS